MFSNPWIKYLFSGLSGFLRSSPRHRSAGADLRRNDVSVEKLNPLNKYWIKSIQTWQEKKRIKRNAGFHLTFLSSALKSGMNLNEALLILGEAQNHSTIAHLSVKQKISSLFPGSLFWGLRSQLLLLHEMGGKGSELLADLAEGFQQKEINRRKLRAWTAQSRFSAVLIALIPWGVFTVMGILDPQMIRIFLGSIHGQLLIIFCLIWELIGCWFISKILKLEP